MAVNKDWLNKHIKDPYVQKAQHDGYRSRAAYKLLELNEKDHIIRKGMSVVDLGAAPGGWSQVAIKLVGAKGRVIGLDLLPMDPINGVDFIQGDFTEDEPLAKLLLAINNEKLDVVISDMAPNLSGNKTIDQPRVLYLLELALDFAKQTLKPGGSFVCKIFQGEGSEAFAEELKKHFKVVKWRKPKASKPASRERYLVAMEFF